MRGARGGAALGLAASVVFAYLAARRVDWGRLGGLLADARAAPVLLSVLFVAALVLLRAMKWRFLTRPVADLALWPTAAAMLLGFLVNNLLPARAGEFVRAWAWGRFARASGTAAFATIVVDRLIDLSTLSAFAAATLLAGAAGWIALRVEPGLLLGVGGACLLAVVAGVAVLLAGPRMADLGVALGARLRRWSPGLALRAERAFADLGRGLGGPGGWGGRVYLLALSAAAWAASAAVTFFAARALGLAIPAWLAAVALVTQSFMIMLPSSPGYVGTFHLGVVMGLVAGGLAKSDALAVAVLLHAIHYLTISAGGLLALAWSGLRLADVLRGRAAEEGG